jgi:predicted ArsR family transcriptional regulator
MIAVATVIEERRKLMPTQTEIRQRENTVVQMLDRVPEASTADVAKELGVNHDAAGHLLRRLAAEGRIARHGRMWGHAEAGTEITRNGADPLRRRYLLLLARRAPERMFELLESGRVELSDELLDALEETMF